MTSPFAFALDGDSELSGLHTVDSNDTLLITLAFVDEFQLSSSAHFGSDPAMATASLSHQSQELQAPELVSQELLAHVLDVEVDQQHQHPGDEGATTNRLVHSTVLSSVEETDNSLVEQVLGQTGVVELLQSTTLTANTWHHSGQNTQQQPSDPGGLSAPIASTNKNNRNKQTTKQQQKSQLIKTCGGGGGRRAAPTRHASNKARDERKEELIYLRRRVSELEQQLANKDSKLRQQRLTPSLSLSETAARSLMTTNPTGTCRNPRPSSATASLWQEIVSRQYSQRVKAERENIRLKLVLENQLKIAKSLEKVLQKVTSTKDFKNLVHGVKPSYSSHFLPPQASNDSSGARRLFEELLAGMDQSHANAEAIFEANGVAHMETSTIDAIIRSDESVGIELEVFGNKVLPFDMRAAGSVVWHHYAFAKDRIPNRVYHHNSPQTLNATEDTILEDFNLELDVDSATALFHAKQVVRRYTEESRIVIVWRTFFDPLHIANEPTPGVRFLERGYIVIKQPRTSAAGTTSVVLQTCYISSPVMTGDLVDAHSATLRKIIDFVLGATSANISSSHEMIENVLLEHAIKAQYVK